MLQIPGGYHALAASFQWVTAYHLITCNKIWAYNPLWSLVQAPLSRVCFRPPSASQNICSKGRSVLFLFSFLIHHRHTHGLYLNQPDDSTYHVLGYCGNATLLYISQCLPSISVLTLLGTGNQQFSDTSCTGAHTFRSSALEGWLSSASPHCNVWPVHFPLPVRDGLFHLLCRNGLLT